MNDKPYSYSITAEARGGEYTVWWRYNDEPFMADSFPDKEAGKIYAQRLVDELNKAYERGAEDLVQDAR